MRFYSRAATAFVGFKRAAERLRQIDWFATFRAMREVRMADWEGRFTSKEQVVSQLHWYIQAYGGQEAQRHLDREAQRLSKFYPALVFKSLLRKIGRKPDQIILWVRRNLIHVDTYAPTISTQMNRMLTPLETLFIGLGQCGTFANLAAVLLFHAGYRSRLWAVHGHTFLEYRTESGRWQLEDVDVLPPTTRLPRGLSMQSLRESRVDWTPILEALPSRNRIPLTQCFLPTDKEGKLYEIGQRDWFYGFSIGTNTFTVPPLPPEQFPFCKSVGLTDDGRGYLLSFDIHSDANFVVTACFSRARLGDPLETLEGAQHDVFLAASIEEVVGRHLEQGDEIVWARVNKTHPEVQIVPGLKGTLWLTILLHREDMPTAFPFLEFQSRELLPTRQEQEPAPGQEGAGATCPDSDDTAIWKETFRRVASHHPNAFRRSADAAVLARSHRDLVRQRLPQATAVLDAGCGTGEWAIALARTYERVVAIDLNSPRLRFLQELLLTSNLRPPIRVLQGSLEQLPFEAGSFDLIYCRGVIFLIDAEWCLMELSRVLRPGGTVFLNVNADAWSLHHRLEDAGPDPDASRQGRDTLYNTIWRRSGPEVWPVVTRTSGSWRRELSGLEVTDAQQLSRLDVDTLLGCYERVLSSLGSSDRMMVRRLELQARRACGDEHLSVIIADLLAIGAGLRTRHSSSVSSQAWLPKELKELSEKLGFEGFKWGPVFQGRTLEGGEPLDYGVMRRERNSQHHAKQHFRGAVTVWECEFEKPYA